MKCFYHSADLDGHCSGAIIREALLLSDSEMFPIDYGDPFPWEEIRSEIVYMVDFCLQPFEDMLRLQQACSALVWIDHHQVINSPQAKKIELAKDFRRLGVAGCELAWEFFYPDYPIPQAVRLLGRYDVWDHADPCTLPFQYGMRLRNTMPTSENMELWRDLFWNWNDGIIDNIIEDGRIIMRYDEQLNEKYCRTYSHETQYPGGLRAICINRGRGGSRLFLSIYNPTKHDIMVSYCRRNGRWDVGLYSDKPEVDCAALASEHGGGGHKAAAGFQCEALPFDH